LSFGACETDIVESFSAKFPQKLVEVLEKHEAELVEESISFDYDYWTSGEFTVASCVICESAVLKNSRFDFDRSDFTSCSSRGTPRRLS